MNMIKNSLNRLIPDDYKPFVSSSNYNKFDRILIEKKESLNNGNKLVKTISDVFDNLKINDGMTISFHHYLRDGDNVLNMVISEIKRRNLKNIVLAPSAIFPCHFPLCELIENQNVTKIYTNYLNGEVSKTICNGKLKDLLIMNTHGGRPRAIESGELHIDVAFISVPCSDEFGNGNGIDGKSACGSLGYAISDMLYADKKVVVTDNLVQKVEYKEIDGKYIDYVVKVDSLGDASKIVSGTTKITKDPVGLKIARDATKFIDEAGYIKEGFSMQTGAGGTSLAVTSYVREVMKEKNVHASFASGGITAYFTQMLEEGLIDKIYDVQSFDLSAVKSLKENRNHIAISGSKYANPFDDSVVNKLDFVILGATEVDLNFNVNVTTSSMGNIIGGSGGHADTANGAKLTVIVTPLVKSRIPIIKKEVTTITTPGSDVDVIVTDRGIAINPLRKDLIDKMKKSKLNIVSIEELYQKAYSITGIPSQIKTSKEVIGVVMYRDGTVIDSLYKI